MGFLETASDLQDRRGGRSDRLLDLWAMDGRRLVCMERNTLVSTMFEVRTTSCMSDTHCMKLNDLRPLNRLMPSKDPVHRESMTTTSWFC